VESDKDPPSKGHVLIVFFFLLKYCFKPLKVRRKLKQKETIQKELGSFHEDISFKVQCNEETHSFFNICDLFIRI
jgi:hypothetical protein